MPARSNLVELPARRMRARSDDSHVLAVLAPMSGSAGIWGPSCISSAQLAISEINRADGIGGQRVVPLFLDSDDCKTALLECEIADLVEEGAIRAIVGMSVSCVRQRLNKIVRGAIPYVYTPLYEGNEHSQNVYTIGETPRDQLEAAIAYLSGRLRVRRWALIGNDYVWPRTTHAVARRKIAECGGSVVFDGYVEFGLHDAEWLVQRITERKPEIVLISLVGQDAVEFNRAFGALDADRGCFRFSTAIDENVLLATGARNTKRLFVASSYFSALATPENQLFRERYNAIHAGCPPMLNSLGQSLYEGLHFYSAMQAERAAGRTKGPVRFRSARGGEYHANDRNNLPIFLARADGHGFEILNRLA
jgi:ABC-type branched-subunit amino acid transport system substrate-binding protein